MDRQQVAQAIKQIETGLATLKQLFQTETPKPSKVHAPTPAIKISLAESLPKQELGPTPDWQDNNWPEAVPQRLIVNENSSDQEKRFRAIQILNMLNRDLSGQYCLDLGCGTGHITNEIAEITKVIGYDVIEFDSWQQFKNVDFTCNKGEIPQGFDFILCYDVIDHIVRENPVDMLSWAASLLAPNGVMSVRTHPWTSRHGSHSYENVNKAYVHLALTAEELSAAGIPVNCALRLNRPMAAYEGIFRSAGLTIIDKQMTVSEVDDYFSDDLLSRINKVTWRGNMTVEMAKKIMRTQFVDYLLRRS